MTAETEKDEKWWAEEIEKCSKSPYYFMKNYVSIDGDPFITVLSEQQYNDMVFHPEKYFSPKRLRI